MSQLLPPVASMMRARRGYAMNFYLAVWNSLTAISDDEAAARYRVLSDEKPAEPFDGKVYAFYCCLT